MWCTGCNISDDTIAGFEAAGVSSEWDSSAMCYISLLKHIWQFDPKVLPPEREDKNRLPVPIQPPNFSDLPNHMAASGHTGLPVLERAEKILLSDGHLQSDQCQFVQYYIRNARNPVVLTHLLFQELIVGSLAFEQVYQLKSVYQTGSYLKLYDVPKMDAHQAAGIMEWSKMPDHAAALFTARPGIAPPPGLFTPDAEIGAELLGLDEITLASEGKLAHLARQLGLDEESLVKPAPAHSLMALLLAIGFSLADILPAMRAFLDGEKPSEGLLGLNGIEVTLFEDGIGGILSLQKTCRKLMEMGIEIHARYIGISDHPIKAAALAKVGAKVYGKLDDALAVELFK